jgi:hypothetical protein
MYSSARRPSRRCRLYPWAWTTLHSEGTEADGIDRSGKPSFVRVDDNSSGIRSPLFQVLKRLERRRVAGDVCSR